MMDTYQPIYDAVRSRISNGDLGSVVADVARNAFDISHTVSCLYQDFSIAAEQWAHAGREQQRPFVLLKPRMFPDGNSWCALYGENLQDGVCAFGDTPEKAAIQFDIEWLNQKARKEK